MFRIPFLFLYEVYSITLVILNEAGHLSNNDRHGLMANNIIGAHFKSLS